MAYDASKNKVVFHRLILIFSQIENIDSNSSPGINFNQENRLEITDICRSEMDLFASPFWLFRCPYFYEFGLKKLDSLIDFRGQKTCQILKIKL